MNMMNKHFQYVKTQKQGGFALFLVLVAMLVIAFLVVATLQSTNMESRSSANDADRKVAMNRAESALSKGEDAIRGFTDRTTNIDFKQDCTNGYCTPQADTAIAGIPATITSAGTTIQLNLDTNPCTGCKDVWLRDNVLVKNKDDDHSIAAPAVPPATVSKSRYVIEFLGTRADAGGTVYLFRITAKGWGDNENTQVLLQSNVEATFPS